jgi:30S ribosomal protein S31
MGKGDKKTRKGKIAMGSYGKTRPHDFKKKAAAPVAEPEAKK